MKDPAFYARWVRKVHDLETAAPLDVDLLVTRCGIEVYADEFDGFLGLWLRAGSKEGIVLDARQSARRRRFTLAHELGHACLPGHRKATILKCLASDVSDSDSARSIEAEANSFAAELLAPKKLIAPLLRTGAFDLVKAREIAEQFEISLTCAARRLVETCGQPAALVLCEGGRVSWCVRRNGLPYGLPGTGDPVPLETIAADIEAGAESIPEAKEVDMAAWLPMSEVKGPLMESAVHLGSLGQVVSLLWIPDLEAKEEEI